MIKELWQLLKPFHRTVLLLTVLVTLYELAQMGQSYIISAVIRLQSDSATNQMWLWFFFLLVTSDEVLVRLDNAIDWHIISRQLYPMYKHIKSMAISKFLEMDIEWHHDRSSGVLVEKINSGTEKVHGLVDAACWDFFPTLIQTAITIAPLAVFSSLTAWVALISLTVFVWLTILANRFRLPFRKQRHDLYDCESEASVEAVR